jgi:hypothetical protein
MVVKIHNFWPLDPDTWFRQLESKFRVCQISSLQTKFDHPWVRCPRRSAVDSYEQLKALLVSRYTKARWTRAFKLLKFPEIGDMKPADLMRQMKTLLPTDSRPCTVFLAMFLLHLPSEMRDHLIAKYFKECTLMAEYANLLYISRASCTIDAVKREFEAAIRAISSRRHREFSPHDQRQECVPRAARGAAARRLPGRTRRTVRSVTTTPHTATGPRNAILVACRGVTARSL